MYTLYDHTNTRELLMNRCIDVRLLPFDVYIVEGFKLIFGPLMLCVTVWIT